MCRKLPSQHGEISFMFVNVFQSFINLELLVSLRGKENRRVIDQTVSWKQVLDSEGWPAILNHPQLLYEEIKLSLVLENL